MSICIYINKYIYIYIKLLTTQLSLLIKKKNKEKPQFESSNVLSYLPQQVVSKSVSDSVWQGDKVFKISFSIGAK